ncbi:MAG: VWA domain-containing protein, partial [Verrucomicrobia bacterium]|nr:VWA domain-containing protein [Verrucomicrobiota bacterium]
AAAMPTETPTDDTVLATAGLTSALPIVSAPPVIAPPSSASATGTEKMMSRPSVRPGAKASAVNFFGVKGEGTNVYFVVDVSDSMVEQDKGGIDGYRNLKEKLGKMIQSLAPETSFNIVFYGDAADLFMPTSVFATPENQKAAIKFLEQYMASTAKRGNISRNYKPKIATLPSMGGTSRMDLGLAAAFEGRADTIFVLTDGKPVIRRAMDEKEREEYRKKMADAEISVADRQKFEKEVAEYRKDFEKYNEELKKYREKYADKLQEKARKEAENRAKGKGRVIEGQGFVVDPVKVPGLPDPPKAPVVPPPPARKNQGQAVAAPDLGNWTDDQILEYLKDTIAGTYKKDGYDLPSIHGVAFMSKSSEEKFLRSLASRNNGTFMRVSAPIKETSEN